MRAELIESELKRLIPLFTEEKSVVRVFVFGSAANLESVREESDIDICVIQNTSLGFYDRIAYWLRKIEPTLGMDIVVYTPEEYEDLRSSNYFVRDEIEKKGKMVYAA